MFEKQIKTDKNNELNHKDIVLVQNESKIIKELKNTLKQQESKINNMDKELN